LDSVDSSGFCAIASPMGSLLMLSMLPSPDCGRSAQPGPNGAAAAPSVGDPVGEPVGVAVPPLVGVAVPLPVGEVVGSAGSVGAVVSGGGLGVAAHAGARGGSGARASAVRPEARSAVLRFI